MISSVLGHIQNNLYKLGIDECPIYLLNGPEPVIFDAGVSCAGKIYFEAVQSVIGHRKPSILFLTHVHWDHCGAVYYLKNKFPQMKVAASNLSVRILKRPNALALIKQLNESIVLKMKTLPEFASLPFISDTFCPFDIDIEIEDGQMLDLGENTIVQMLATPGHTQDHFSYFMPREKILMAGEAAGVYYGPGIVSTEFVYNYEAYLSSLKRLALLPAEIFCQGHYQYLIGREEISTFFEQSINGTIQFKERVLELLDREDGSADRVINRLKAERYDIISGPKQPEFAYLLNLRAQVAHLAAKN